MKRAGRYLKNLRLSGLNYGENNEASTLVSSVPVSSNSNTSSSTASVLVASSDPRYSAAAAFVAKKSSSSSLLTWSSRTNTAPITLTRKKPAWGGNSKGKVTKKTGGSAVAVAAREQPQNGNAIQFMAKEKA